MLDIRRLTKAEIGREAEFLCGASPPIRHGIEDDSISEVIGSASFDDVTLRKLLDRAASDPVASTNPAALDSMVAIDLHKALPLERSIASDVSMWAWMGVCVFPDYIRVRHMNPITGCVTADRYRSKVKQGLSRLWWAVELTCDHSYSDPTRKYELSKKFLSLPGFQDLNEALVGRSFSSCRQLVDSIIRLVGSKPESIRRKVSRDLQCILTTIPLELMSQAQIDDEVNHLLKAGKSI